MRVCSLRCGPADLRASAQRRPSRRNRGLRGLSRPRPDRRQPPPAGRCSALVPVVRRAAPLWLLPVRKLAPESSCRTSRNTDASSRRRSVTGSKHNLRRRWPPRTPDPIGLDTICPPIPATQAPGECSKHPLSLGIRWPLRPTHRTGVAGGGFAERAGMRDVHLVCDGSARKGSSSSRWEAISSSRLRGLISEIDHPRSSGRRPDVTLSAGAPEFRRLSRSGASLETDESASRRTREPGRGSSRSGETPPGSPPGSPPG